jgi:hypothetical protein
VIEDLYILENLGLALKMLAYLVEPLFFSTLMTDVLLISP